MIRLVLKQLRRAHANLRQTEHIYMVLVAVVIGLLGGLCAVGFRAMIHYGQQLFWLQEKYTLDYIGGLPWYWKIAAPAIGGLFVGLIVHYFAREAKGHGVPEVMEAMARRGGRMRPRVVIGKMIASAICIASGGSVGREGPIVQVGATVGSTVGQWLRIDEKRLRTMVGCGAAAGIAAAFNAPIAGALFAVEIILGDFAVTQFSPIVISSVAATVVSHYFEGNFPAFNVHASYEMKTAYELFAYAFLGVAAGLVALAFVKILYASEDLWDKIKLYPPAKTVIGGMLIGVIALGFPEIYGVGYEAIDAAINGKMIWYLMALLILMKIVAVSTTIGSGGSGGVFAPSLFIGAMTGGALGTAVHALWPLSTAGPGAYALVGMGAVVAAGTHAPITAIIIIFEITGAREYSIILPLMISCIISTMVATGLKKESIYTLKLLRRGINIHGGRDINVLRHLFVRDVLRDNVQTIRPDSQLMPVMSEFINHPDSAVFVVDDDRRLLGVITIDDIRPILADVESLEFLVIARDMMKASDFPTVGPGDNLDAVMKRLGHYRGEVPVLEEGRLLGSIWPEDVIERYNMEVFKRDMAYGMASAIGAEAGVEPIRGVKGIQAGADIGMAEVPAPARFVGRTIADLNIRKRYDVSLLLIKRRRAVSAGEADGGADGERWVSTFPDADYVFLPGDIMLVMGPTDKLRRLERTG